LDTKSKKSKSVKSFRAKAVAFALCVLLGAGGLMALALGVGYVTRQLDESSDGTMFIGNRLVYEFGPAGTTNVDRGAVAADMLSGKPYVDSAGFRARANDSLRSAINIFDNGNSELAEGTIKSIAESDLEISMEQIYNILVGRLKKSKYAGAAVTRSGIDVSSLVYEWRGQTVLDEEDVASAALAPIEFDARSFMDKTDVFSLVAGIDSEGNVEYSLAGADVEDWYPRSLDDSDVEDLEPSRSHVRTAFEKTYASEISRMKSELEQFYAERWKLEYADVLDELANGDMLYCISDGKRAIANVALNEKFLPADTSVFTSSPAWLSLGGGTGQSAPSLSSKPEMLKKAFPDYGWEKVSLTVYAAWKQEAITKGEAAMASARQASLCVVLPAIAAIIIAVVLFILSIAWTGRRRSDERSCNMELCAWDNVFAELQIMLMVLVGVCSLYSLPYTGAGLRSFNIGLLAVFAIFAAACAIELWCLLSIVRIAKARMLPRRLISWIVLNWARRGVRDLARAIKSGFDGSNPLAKTVMLVGALWFAAALVAGIVGAIRYQTGYAEGLVGVLALLAVLVLALYFSVKWVKRYGELKRGVEEIAGGNLKYKIPVGAKAHSEFERLSLKINAIGAATDVAIQGELKNQRLKTDLISNVSHDLKTPLTSIITYTDLLKKEGLDSGRAAEYLNVIDEKSRRLKKLTEDLFEAAKASSGAIPVRREKVDLLSLVKQELVELGDGLAGIDLEVVVGAQSEHCYVNADSQLVWRVVDNLLNNVRKYAMPGSRVYIDLHEYKAAGRPPTISLEIKNTSAAKLNIPADELMERFQRGDASRATEGSGLGLSIARDLVRLMDGRFDIAIDGDLFKAIVTLDGWEE
jgi:signal transduction histidine kinase